MMSFPYDFYLRDPHLTLKKITGAKEGQEM